MKAFTIIDAAQRSDEWRKARIGRVTGSKVDAITAFNKDKSESAKRRDYRLALVCERLTGEPQDSDYTNRDMERGVELEPLALAAYEVHTGELIQTTGFIQADAIMAGCSLDGHVGDFTGIVECKAPRPANHLKYLRSSGVPTEHRAQIVHALWITGAEWADFVSFCPQMPEPLHLLVVRLARDNAEIQAHAASVGRFLEEVAAEEAAIRGIMAVTA